MGKILWLAILVAALPLHTALAQASQDNRPKIGLALSGGGARGAAHIGVLKVLEELHIPIDYVAGTSMGSIIGGLYASGMSPDQIQAAFKSIDWDHIFDDDPPRQDLSFRRKRDDDTYLVKAKPGITDDGKLKFPTGAIQGQKFDLVLRDLTLPVSQVTDFDRLPVPFRAVASEIDTGKRVVLASGDLATAMRASMAVPGVFAAAEIDGKLLVDGGITDNLPIDVVRAMGADIVIAVDISSPYLPADKINNLFDITAQLTTILTRTNAEQQLATLTDRDILIVPDLGDISSGDFLRAASDAPKTGRVAAQAQREKLARLSLSAPAFEAYMAGRERREPGKPPVIAFVRIVNNSTVEDELIRDRLHQETGAPLNRKQLEQDIANIYGLELFQTVGYELVEENGETGLVINARARSWGPNYLQFGLEMTGNGEGQNSFNLGLAYLRTGINALNGEIRTALQIGAEPGIGAEWYQPLDPLSRYFVTPKARIGAYNVGIYDNGETHLAEYRVTEADLEFAAGREFSTYSDARLGYRFRTGSVDLKTGTPGWPEYDFDTASVFARLAGDRLDNFNFPTHGWLSSLGYSLARKSLGGDADFDQMEARASGFTTVGDGHVLGLGGFLETTLNGEAPVQNRYRIGGFLNLSGYDQNSLSGQQAAVLAAIYYRRFTPLPFLSWYAGGSLEYGGVWESNDDIGKNGIASGSLFLGADTPVGPFYVGYGHAEGDHNAVFFYLGRPLFN